MDPLARIVPALSLHGGRLAAALPLPDGSLAITVYCRDLPHQQEILTSLRGIPGLTSTGLQDDVFALHRGGKLQMSSTSPLKSAADLARQYTPGVARICRSIAKVPDRARILTQRRNLVAVVSDGSAILGLGNLGPAAALPVMEGKAILFKEFGGVDAFPIVLASQDMEEIVATVTQIAPSFAGINLEDISAPRCFAIEDRLKNTLDIPVFHDDQHGTAIVVLAAIQNACRVTGKDFSRLRVVVLGVGAAGTACIRLLTKAGVGEIIGVNRGGSIFSGKPGLSESNLELAKITNPRRVEGGVVEALAGADVFLGLSGPNLLPLAGVKAMAPDPIVLAMSNPDPEIDPEVVRPWVAVLATGRSDYPNQVNNVLAFPGLFRGALDAGATQITGGMCLAASAAIASLAERDGVNRENIIPNPLDRRVAPAVAEAVAEAARQDGVARDFPPVPGIDELSDC
jgi:malate dehydrogenase (oxaloacetate-decarboxylating)